MAGPSVSFWPDLCHRLADHMRRGRTRAARQRQGCAAAEAGSSRILSRHSTRVSRTSYAVALKLRSQQPLQDRRVRPHETHSIAIVNGLVPAARRRTLSRRRAPAPRGARPWTLRNCARCHATGSTGKVRFEAGAAVRCPAGTLSCREPGRGGPGRRYCHWTFGPEFTFTWHEYRCAADYIASLGRGVPAKAKP